MANAKLQQEQFQGIPGWLIETKHSTCFVAKQGAQVLSFKIGSDPDLLWLSNNTGSDLTFKTPIRGGIPLCWPWFAKEGQVEPAIQHGLVRSIEWQLLGSTSVSDSSLEARFAPLNRPESNLEAELFVRVGSTLEMELTTQNIGNQAAILTQAFHTYFAVANVQQCQIQNLENTIYRDKLQGYAEFQQVKAFDDIPPYDRIYLNTNGKVGLTDPVRNTQVSIESTGSRSVVVWNPGPGLAESIGDIKNQWPEFVCIEVANSQSDARLLSPGESHALTMRISCEKKAY